LKAGLLTSGNLSVPLEDPKYLWEPTTTHDHGNLDTNLIILFIFMLFCQTNYMQVICIIYGCDTGTLTLHCSRSPKLLSLIYPG